MGPKSEDVKERGEGAICCSGPGRGRGQAAIASARTLAPSHTPMPAQRMDA